MTTTTILCFFFNDTATTEIYTLSLHDALPISHPRRDALAPRPRLGSARRLPAWERPPGRGAGRRSEEHTSELQSRLHLVCRLLLEKKKTDGSPHRTIVAAFPFLSSVVT